MKIYAITIKPEAPFGTPLKGDTLFGQFCWQAVLDEGLLDKGFDYWIKRYQEKPFAVFSSAWPQIVKQTGTTVYYLPRPTMPVIPPSAMSKKDLAEWRKKEKMKKWLMVASDKLDSLAAARPVNDSELYRQFLETLPDEEQRSLQYLSQEQCKPIITSGRAHNSINRLTMTTGRGFDPFTVENFHYLSGLKLVLFVAIDEEALDKERLCLGLKNIGLFGFGRDASIGLGRFSLSLENVQIMDWPSLESGDGCYTLAPCVPENSRFEEQFAIPFTRFGRHGDRLGLSNNPFKNPIVMAEEGAVFYSYPGKEPGTPYIGSALTGLSLVEKNTVAQGYSLYLPMPRRNG